MSVTPASVRPGIGKQASIVVIGDALNFASGIVSAMILARVLPVETMGTYRQIIYLGPMMVSMAELGLSATIYRFWNALDPQRRIVYVKILVMSSLVLSLLASGTLAMLAPVFSQWYQNPGLKMALLISAPYPLASIPLMLLRPALLSQGRAVTGTCLEGAFGLLSTLSLIIPLFLGLSLTSALIIWMIVSLLRLLVIPVIFKEYLWHPGPWWSYGLVREVWKYLWPIQVGQIPAYVTQYLDKIAMSVFLTTQGFAIYSLGAREIPFVGAIGYSVASVLIPHLVEDVQANRQDQINRRWRLACQRTAMSTYLIGAFCVWYAVPLMQLLFSKAYSESSVPFRVFAALTFLRVVEYASLAKALGRTDLIMHSAFIGSGAVLLLAFPLAWAWGPFGMALAVCSGSLFVAGYYLFQYQKILQSHLKDFFPWQRLLGLLLIAFLSTAIVGLTIGPWMALMADTSFFSLGWKLGTLFIISGTIYLPLLVLFGYLQFDLKKTAARMGVIPKVH
jgi:O-antigen/teichoic acid export membrane protein